MSFATFHYEHGTFSMPNSISMSWLYILTACIRTSSSFLFFANSLMSSKYIRYLIFSCDLVSLYPAVHFLSMWLSGIMAIMNSKGDRASPWKIPLDFCFSQASSPSCQFHRPGFHGFLDKVYDFMGYFVHFEAVYYLALWNHIIIIIIVIIYSEFFTSVLADGLSLEFVTASVPKSPGLFSVFWLISVMLLFGWSPLVFLFPSHPVSLLILWWLYKKHQSQLI